MKKITLCRELQYSHCQIVNLMKAGVLGFVNTP